MTYDGEEVNHDHRSRFRAGSRGLVRLRLRLLARGGPLSSLAVAATTTSRAEVAAEQAKLCARVAQDNKGQNILVLDLRGLTQLYDYFILITGASRRQIHTITEEIDAALKAQGEKRLSIQGYQTSRWIVQDYGDIIVHVFDPEARAYYELEELWADAKRVDWER